MIIDVYVDMVFFINFAINAALLWLTNALCRRNAKWWRIALGGAASGLFYVLLLFSPLRPWLNVFTSFIVLAPGVLTAFGWRGSWHFGISLGMAYAAAFALGGLALVIMHIAPSGDLSTLGMAAAAASPVHLIIAVAAAFCAIKFVKRHIASKVLDRQVFKEVTVRMGEKSVKLQALADTGMTLCCPISGNPVIVAELALLKAILPESVISMDFSDLQNIVEAFEQAELTTRLRMLPYKTVSSPNAVISGFRADSVTIDGVAVKGIIIGICNFELGNGEYNALLNPVILGGLQHD